jgi:hypothetical protein
MGMEEEQVRLSHKLASPTRILPHSGGKVGVPEYLRRKVGTLAASVDFQALFSDVLSSLKTGLPGTNKAGRGSEQGCFTRTS